MRFHPEAFINDSEEEESI